MLNYLQQSMTIDSFQLGKASRITKVPYYSLRHPTYEMY